MGENGHGKTNVLEAIHYLAALRSFRGTRHADAIAFGSKHFRVEGRVAYADGRERRVAVAADRSTRRVTVDGNRARSASEAVGTVLTVFVGPGDQELVAGGPAGRRGYLDDILARSDRRYARTAGEYDRILKQRNELLRSPARAAAPVLDSWDEALVEKGASIVAERATVVERATDRFAQVAARVAGGRPAASYGLAYRPSVPVEPEDASDPQVVAEAFAEALGSRLERDRARGWTTVGPHRDEVEIRMGGRSLARFGSQGERRTAAIALRLVEMELLEAVVGKRPILLLDDVFSELDRDRANRLLERLDERHQRFVTTPRPLPWLEGTLPRWDVEDGRIAVREAVT